MATKLFTVHEKKDLAEPSERVVLVREGFALWAFVLTILWLIAQRLWLAALAYTLLLGALMHLGQQFSLHPLTLGLAQLLLQLLLGFSAYDLKRQSLRRRGYVMTGVVAAETPLNAERRYYDHFAA